MYEGNNFWKQTIKDVKSIASDKHPKDLYTQCMADNSYWHHFVAGGGSSTEDVAMIICKDLGCELNYCGLIKKSVPSEWEGSSDCSSEYKLFSDCMKIEQ